MVNSLMDYQTLTERIKAEQREISSCNEVLYGWSVETTSGYQIARARIVREIEVRRAAVKALERIRKALKN